MLNKLSKCILLEIGDLKNLFSFCYEFFVCFLSLSNSTLVADRFKEWMLYGDDPDTKVTSPNEMNMTKIGYCMTFKLT